MKNAFNSRKGYGQIKYKQNNPWIRLFLYKRDIKGKNSFSTEARRTCGRLKDRKFFRTTVSILSAIMKNLIVEFFHRGQTCLSTCAQSECAQWCQVEVRCSCDNPDEVVAKHMYGSASVAILSPILMSSFDSTEYFNKMFKGGQSQSRDVCRPELGDVQNRACRFQHAEAAMAQTRFAGDLPRILFES